MAISPKMNPRISSPISSFRTAARKTGSWYPTVIPRLPATIAPVNAASAGVAASFCAMPSAPISGARRQLGMSAGSNGICFAASAIDSAWVCTYVTPIAKNPTVDIARPPMVASPFSKFGISPSFPPSISSTRPAAANTSMIAMNMFISRTSQLFPISLFLYFSVSTYSPSIRYISLSITVLFSPRQQLYQHTPDGQHQCPAGARHNLCKWKQFHPFRTAEHRHISGTAHVRRTHPRCDR